MKNKGGRPTVRTPQTAQRLVELVGKGVPYKHACAAAGISYSVFCEWRAADPQFAAQLDEAISQGVEARLKSIAEAAATDWRAAEAWLRLVLPAEFGRNRVELTGPGGTPLAAGIQLYLPKKEAAPIVEAAA